MPRPSEQTSESHTLPPAELNPLINPLLAENMGRWAEVYFTSPPENREQAVLDLLRELEADKSRREAHLASELAAQPPLVRCENCGYDNPATNRFCGMCGGVALAEARGSTEGFAQHEANGNSDSQPEPRADAPYSYGDSSAPRHELSLFQAYRETDADGNDDWNYEPVASSSYRGYIGVVLAFLILGLGYMAWRGMQNSQGSHAVSAPPPVAAQQIPSETQPPAPATSGSGDTAASAKTPAESAPPAASSSAPPEAKVPAREPEADTEAAAPPETSTKASRPGKKAVPAEAAADKWGSEELAVAQRYLNGASGQRRDTTEAAKWLWKSIAKHNGQATLMLADLYLKGDGVSKNCDQARVLLYSAARKGVSGAGERLRNLPAFGCQ